MTITIIFVTFLFYIVEITAFFPKLLTVRNILSRGIKDDKKYTSYSSLARPDLSIENATKNDDKKKVLYTFYKLVCNNLDTEEVFVGYTIMTMENVLNKHKIKYNYVNGRDYNRDIYKIIRATGGFSYWSTEILEKGYFKNIGEVKQRKKEWIEKTPNDVNMYRPIRTLEERNKYKKEYYDDNLIAIRKYYIDNKITINKQQKEHYIDNKETILEKQNQYNENHKLEKKLYNIKYNEANKERITERQMKHYEANRERILERTRKWRETNRDVINEKRRAADKIKFSEQANRDVINEKQNMRRAANKIKLNKEKAMSTIE
jgi:hypothetical protein